MIRATFIGIDKYSDPEIRNLTGARRDATALWALFSDTMTDDLFRLLVDEQATLKRIRAELDETVRKASSEDIVIVSFSGHGSHDHRIGTYDSQLNNLQTSTLGMDELADLFKRSPAKIILFILDCCFSGEVPARVLENSPVPRDLTNPLQTLAGAGRILIAASNFDEAALELPDERHGLLTKALIDVFQGGKQSISLPSAMDEVMQLVQADATRLCIKQTPVLYGYVEGGLILPTLHKGQNYFRAFPETKGINVGESISDLAAFQLPEQVISAWGTRFPNGLNELQLEAINRLRIMEGGSGVVIAPTSSGKTFIGEMAAARAIIDGRKAVFLLPYRALVNEKYDDFEELYGKTLGMRVIHCTGDYLDQTSELIRGKYDVALLTYEMFLNLAVSLPSILNQFGLVVIDEAQFITDPNRGIVVELLLSLLIMARKRGINPQLLTLSAVIGPVNDFDKWLGIQTLITHKRPVPLEEGVMDRSGNFLYIDASGKEASRQLLSPGAIIMRRDREEMQDMIVPLVKSLINLGEKVIIFRNQKGSAEGSANYLSKELGLPAASEAISELPNHDLSTTSMKLRSCLEGGTAFHNANLARGERLVVERHFRNPKSPVKVLVATTTVAAGINTSASTVILAESEFKGEDGRPFTVSEYKNMVGRAGRLGFNEEGKGILLAQTSYERDRLFKDYVSGALEAIHSSFNSDDLGSWLIKLLAQVKKVPKRNIVGLLAETYGGFLQAKKDPSWKIRMASQAEQLISRLATNNLIEYEGENVQLTLLGQVCGRSALSLDSTLRLVDWLGKIPSDQLTAQKLMALVQGLAEIDRIYTPMVKRGRSEASWPSLVYPIYGQDIVGCLQRNVSDQMAYFARCKRAAVLWDWINGLSIESIENKYSKNQYFSRIEYGNIIGIADATRFYLRPAYEIAAILVVQSGIIEESIEQILKQLEVGLPADALSLLSLPIPLNRGEYLELFKQGIKNPNELWLLDDDNIQKILGEERRKSLAFYRA